MLVHVFAYFLLIKSVWGIGLEKEYELPFRALVLGTADSIIKLPTMVIDSLGGQYDAVNFEDEDESAVNFYSDADKTKPKYNCFILTSAQLGKESSDGKFYSVFSKEKWDELHEYQKKYGVRSVILQSSYVIDPALESVAGLEKGTNADAVLTFAQTDYVEEIRGNVKSSATFRLGSVNDFGTVDYWYYPATFQKSANVNNLQPIMYINSRSKDGVEGAENWIGAFTRVIDGIEEMHFVVNTNHFGHHGFVLADMWYPWVQRGLFIGQRRMYLDTQVDDVFLGTNVYNVKEDRQGIPNIDPIYRFSGSDFKELIEYQRDLNKKLPEGSRFVISLAFNGLGWYNFADLENNVNLATDTYKNEIFWITHTWSHLDLYCYFSNCDTYGKTKYKDSFWNMERNLQFAKETLFWDLSMEELKDWPTWSATSIVTPRISGLNHTETIKSMIDNGHIYAVGDNSRPDTRPENIYHTFPTHVADDKGRRVTVIPRWATRIYFDVSTPAQSAKEHNSIYGPNCFGNTDEIPVTYPKKCNTTTFKYEKDLSVDEMLQIESFENARNLLNYRWDPYMFHQANLRFFHHNGKRTCLMCMWIDTILDYLTHYSDMPIVTLRMDELADKYKEREDRDECEIQGYLQFKNGEPSKIRMDSKFECTAKVTKTPIFKKYFNKELQEKYGPDYTIDVPLAGANGANAFVEFSDSPDFALQEKLPYPPAVAPPNRTKDMMKKTPDEFVLEQIFKLDKQILLKQKQDVEFIIEFVDSYSGTKCKNADILRMIEAVSKQWSDVTRPANSARLLDIYSFYRHMESSYGKLEKELKEVLKNQPNYDEDKTTKLVDRAIANVIDESENRASEYNKYVYKSFRDLEVRILKLKNCE